MEKDNWMVWDRELGHYEVWYTTLSHRASQTGFWIRYTLEAPIPGHGEPYAQLWFARFDPHDPEATFGFNRRFPIGDLVGSTTPFSIRIGDAELRHDGIRGALSGGGHEARWDLSWTPAAVTYRLLPDFAYGASFASTQVLSPNQSVAARGTIVVDGRTYTLEEEPAGQTHLWGRKHAYSWGWAHANCFDHGRLASIEALSVRLKRGSIILPTLTVFTLFVDGERLDFRSAWQLPLARGEFRTGLYRFVGISPQAKVEATFTCRPDDMVLAEYVDPDGDPAFCHNSCCATAEIKLSRRSPFVARFRDAGKLVATRTAHFEWAARAGDVVQVKRLHQPLP